MARSLYPPLIALSALTAAILAAAAVVLPPPDYRWIDAAPRADGDDIAVRATVERFYAAVNHGIATGDTAPLGTVLAADYGEGGLTGETAPAIADINGAVRALHEIAPMARLAVASVIVDGDAAAATVTVKGAGPAHLLGLRLVAPVLWGSSDVLRVAGDLVTERRSSHGIRLTVAALDRRVLPIGLTAASMVYAQHIVVSPGDRWSSEPFNGMRVLRVASGAPIVSVQGKPGAGGQGDSMLHDGMEPITVGNQSRDPVTFVELVLARRPPHAPGRGSTPSSEDDAAAVHAPHTAHEGGVRMSSGLVVIASGRITLEPGSRLAWDGGDAAVVLAVASGAAQVQTSTPVRQGDSGEYGATYVNNLVAGDLILVSPGTATTVDISGDAPVEMVVFTVRPMSPGTVAPRPAPAHPPRPRSPRS